MKNIFEDLEVHPIDTEHEKMWYKWQEEQRIKREEYDKLSSMVIYLLESTKSGDMSEDELKESLEAIGASIYNKYSEEDRIIICKNLKWDIHEHETKDLLRKYIKEAPEIKIEFPNPHDEYKEKRKQVIETMRKLGFKPVGF